MGKLEEIRDCLIECGVQAEVRTERVDPYVNVGDVKHVRNRMQFWIPNNTDEVHMFVGREMGKWFAAAEKSVYLNHRYRFSDKENKVEFPNMDLALEFIRKTAES